MENLLIYALIMIALYLFLPNDKNDEVTRLIESNYADYRMELLRGEDDEERI
jgi:hypothetical protein